MFIWMVADTWHQKQKRKYRCCIRPCPGSPSFLSFSKLQAHIINNHMKSFHLPCPFKECHKDFLSSFSFDDHIHNRHPQLVDKEVDQYEASEIFHRSWKPTRALELQEPPPLPAFVPPGTAHIGAVALRDSARLRARIASSITTPGPSKAPWKNFRRVSSSDPYEVLYPEINEKSKSDLEKHIPLDPMILVGFSYNTLPQRSITQKKYPLSHPSNQRVTAPIDHGFVRERLSYLAPDVARPQFVPFNSGSDPPLPISILFEALKVRVENKATSESYSLKTHLQY